MREALRALGIAGFLLVIARQRSPAIAGRSQDLAPETGFGRPYWLVVAVEAAVALGGATILSRSFSAPQADLPWITFVVGAHFFALAVVFRQPRYHLLGTAITACGVVGLVAVVAGAGDPVTAVIAGIVPGFTLLLAALRGTRRPTSGRPPRSECIEASRPLGHLAASIVGNPTVTTATPDESRTLILYGTRSAERDTSHFQAFAASLPGSTAIELGPYNHWFPEPGPWPTITDAIIDLAHR